MGMAIETRRLTMSSPASVSNTDMRVEDFLQVGLLLGNEFTELGYLAYLLEGKHLILLISIHR